MLSALIGVVAQRGEIDRFLGLTRQAEPEWLAVCGILQSCTYLCESLAWKRVLHRFGYRFDLRALLLLSVAKLFSDQAMPSAGISGNTFFLTALHQRGVARIPAMACMLAELTAYFSAYALMTACAILELAWRHGMHRWLLIPMAAFMALQLSVPLALLRFQRRKRMPGASLLARHPLLKTRTESLQKAALRVPLKSALFMQLVALQASIQLLDAATLWAMLRALGLHAPFPPVFASFVTASVVMSASPIPLGLGTFETTCVATLHGAGIGLEAALTATVLLRGTTTWLPMLPGLWLIRREMSSLRQNQTPRSISPG